MIFRIKNTIKSKILIIFFPIIIIYIFLSESRTPFKSISNSNRFVVFSIDIETSSDYVKFYLPITCLAWRQLNFEPVVMVIYSDKQVSNKLAQKSLDYLKLLSVKICYITSKPDYEKITSMIAKIFIGYFDTSFFSDQSYIFQSDIDIIPFNNSYFNIIDSSDSILLYDTSSYNSPLGKFIFRGEEYQMYYMNHIGMRKWQWKEVILFENQKFDPNEMLSLISDYFDPSKVKRNYEIEKGDETWHLNQKIISINIKKYLNNPNHKLFINVYQGTKLESILNDFEWLHMLSNESFSVVHLFQDNYLEKLKLIKILLKRIFDYERYMFLEKYIKEFIEIKIK